MAIADTLNNPYTKWMEGKGPYASIVISSRVRLARNLTDYPFPHLQDEKIGREILELGRKAVTSPEMEQQVGRWILWKWKPFLPWTGCF